MNPNPKLNSLLKEWQPDVALPNRFEAEVWTRISLVQDRSAERFWPSLFGLLNTPQMALGLAALTVFCGIGLAVWQADATQNKQMQAAHAHYLHAVDPFANVSLVDNR